MAYHSGATGISYPEGSETLKSVTSEVPDPCGGGSGRVSGGSRDPWQYCWLVQDFNYQQSDLKAEPTRVYSPASL